MPDTVADNLRAAKALIFKPENWCQGAFSRDKFGNDLRTINSKSTSFCAVAAVVRTKKKNDESRRAIRCIDDAVPPRSARILVGALYYNDERGRSHSDIMEWFDRAIVIAEEH